MYLYSLTFCNQIGISPPKLLPEIVHIISNWKECLCQLYTFLSLKNKAAQICSCMLMHNKMKLQAGDHLSVLHRDLTSSLLYTFGMNGSTDCNSGFRSFYQIQISLMRSWMNEQIPKSLQNQEQSLSNRELLNHKLASMSTQAHLCRYPVDGVLSHF